MLNTSRRRFITQLAAVSGLGILSKAAQAQAFKAADSFYEISLAEWSFHKALFAKKMTNLDFPVMARKQFDIGVVEYVNQFFKDKAQDTNYLNELLKRCSDNNVKNHLIMCDDEGALADSNEAKRKQAVENHYKWVDAAKYLGCKTIRVNAFGDGTAEEVQKAATDGISSLAEYAAKENINVIIENHGGYTSDGQWMVGLMKAINKPNVGTLPDFGNFCVKREGGHQWDGKCIQEYDKYKGVAEMMPYAKGASAKTYDFDANGNCVETDYAKILKIIKDSGFKGYLGIEYEGDHASEAEGVAKTKALINKAAASLG